MKKAIYIIIYFIVFTSCQEKAKKKTNEFSKKDKKCSFIPNEIEKSLPLDTTQIITFPKYPFIGKEYKFLHLVDSVHYVLILKRINDSTIHYRTDNDLNQQDMRYGKANWNQKKNAIFKEISSVSSRLYNAYEFLENTDSITSKLRIGIDSIGSGDRLLIRYIESINDSIITDINMSN